MKKTILLLAALALLAACHRNRRPDNVLDHPTMVAFLSDAYLLEGFYAVESGYRFDSVSDEVMGAYDSVMARHGISREMVEASMEYYSHHPEEYAVIHDSVLFILEGVRDSLVGDLPPETRTIPLLEM